MVIDPCQEETSVVYATMIRAITPRPIAWVSTVSPSAALNLAPFSYFNGVCSRPAALSICPVNKADGSKKDTVRNIEYKGEFVVSVVPYQWAKKMWITSAELEYEESEFEHAGLTPRPSQTISVPGVAESPIHFECELMHHVTIGDGPLAGNLIVGRILLIHIDDAVLDANRKIDPDKVDSVGRMGGFDYCRTTTRFSLRG
jgi:flavin reductase (DIM6/NTAB) family NADH-FMN oxidoreductase RutF